MVPFLFIITSGFCLLKLGPSAIVCHTKLPWTSIEQNPEVFVHIRKKLRKVLPESSTVLKDCSKGRGDRQQNGPASQLLTAEDC